uniref:Si:ch211-107o10.3 n=1 Tax=Poecilia latipinna TaxID=48699 RepID=A0A3B3TIT6_9TELE
MQNYADVLKDFVEKHSTGLTVAAVAIGILGLRRWMAGGVCRSKARLDGKTVLITGANTGIGKVTAMDMAQRARVIMACRDIPKAYSAADEIRQKTGNNNLLVKKLDLASLKSVRELAKYVQENEKRLDILINNAMCPKWQTEDGFEMQIGVNHLGHFLLTNSLLDLLKKSAPSRVVVVSSVAHVTRIHFDDINLDRNYDNLVSYRQSKLANILFARELAARLKTGVTVYSLHPGLIRTELGRHLFPHWSWWKRTMASVLMMFVKSPWEGAQTSIYCAVEESLANESGLYYDCARKKPAAPALDDAAAKRLWDLSASMVGLS